jgi:hypothetical protein
MQTTHPRKMGIGRIGQIEDAGDDKFAKTFVHTTDVTLDGTKEIPFGTLVARSGTDLCLKLAATADPIAGVAVLSDAYDIDNEVGTVGLKEGVPVSCLQRGRIRVLLEETVATGDPVRYRAVATTGENAGAFRTSDPTGTDTVLITQGARFVEGGTVATGAVLEIDVMHLTFTADS